MDHSGCGRPPFSRDVCSNSLDSSISSPRGNSSRSLDRAISLQHRSPQTGNTPVRPIVVRTRRGAYPHVLSLPYVAFFGRAEGDCAYQPVVKVWLHSTGDASPPAALLLPQI